MYVFTCTAALEYFKAHPLGPVDGEELSEACGVGVLVTPEQIQQQVSTISHITVCIPSHCRCMVRCSPVKQYSVHVVHCVYSMVCMCAGNASCTLSD